jgi:hypothetical protein
VASVTLGSPLTVAGAAAAFAGLRPGGTAFPLNPRGEPSHPAYGAVVRVGNRLPRWAEWTGLTFNRPAAIFDDTDEPRGRDRSGCRSAVPAPKEQPPRKLSGKRTAGGW